MSQLKQLPHPVIIQVNDEEIEKLEAEMDALMDKDDIRGVAKFVEIYPLSANTLDNIKKCFGLDYLISNKFNLYNAIKTYGMVWLEK